MTEVVSNIANLTDTQTMLQYSSFAVYQANQDASLNKTTMDVAVEVNRKVVRMLQKTLKGISSSEVSDSSR